MFTIVYFEEMFLAMLISSNDKPDNMITHPSPPPVLSPRLCERAAASRAPRLRSAGVNQTKHSASPGIVCQEISEILEIRRGNGIYFRQMSGKEK